MTINESIPFDSFSSIHLGSPFLTTGQASAYSTSDFKLDGADDRYGVIFRNMSSSPVTEIVWRVSAKAGSPVSAEQIAEIFEYDEAGLTHGAAVSTSTTFAWDAAAYATSSSFNNYTPKLGRLYYISIKNTTGTPASNYYTFKAPKTTADVGALPGQYNIRSSNSLPICAMASTITSTDAGSTKTSYIRGPGFFKITLASGIVIGAPRSGTINSPDATGIGSGAGYGGDFMWGALFTTPDVTYRAIGFNIGGSFRGSTNPSYFYEAELRTVTPDASVVVGSYVNRVSSSDGECYSTILFPTVTELSPETSYRCVLKKSASHAGNFKELRLKHMTTLADLGSAVLRPFNATQQMTTDSSGAWVQTNDMPDFELLLDPTQPIKATPKIKAWASTY